MDDRTAGLVCRTYFSSEMSEKEIADFISVQNYVFDSTEMTRKSFALKFTDNIYGDSVHVIVYNEDNLPVAARAFWRNDIDGALAYQPTDTAVCKEYRRRGLFVMMTNAALKLVPDHAVIYNYPNGNSMPQYLKMGWHKFKTLYTRIFSSVAYSAEREGVIDSDYFHWWVSPQLTEQYRFVRRSGKYYLAKKMGRGRYLVFGQINKEDTYKIKEATPILLTYLSRKRSIYNDKNKTAGVILSRCPTDAVSIPSWKTDVL